MIDTGYPLPLWLLVSMPGGKKIPQRL